MENDKRQYFARPLTEIIKERISVRSYENTPMSDALRKDLLDYLAKLNGPFNSMVRFKLIDTKAAMDRDVKLGTYGMIRGCSSFVASAVKKEPLGLEELGYELEKFVLYATSLDLGTCWLGGTFKKSEFAKLMELDEDELLPIVTPIGYPGKGKNLLDSLVRMAAGSKKRKAWQEIFFNGDFDKELTKSDALIYSDALEMVRLAPSASNKQPWRIVKEKDTFHFYLCHAKGYSDGLAFDIQKVDMGIAMCHFDLTTKEAKIEGTFKNINPNMKLPNESFEYIISWVRQK